MHGQQHRANCSPTLSSRTPESPPLLLWLLEDSWRRALREGPMLTPTFPHSAALQQRSRQAQTPISRLNSGFRSPDGTASFRLSAMVAGPALFPTQRLLQRWLMDTPRQEPIPGTPATTPTLRSDIRRN